MMTESFKTRYVKENHWYYEGYLFSREMRKDIKNSHFHLAPFILFLCVVLKNIYANRHSKIVKEAIKARPYTALWRIPFYLMARLFKAKSWTNMGVYIRLWCGKVDLPYFEIVLTTRCTMRCESCGNLMQYFSPKNQYVCSLEGILEALNSIFELVDSVGYINILGGEPLLFRDIVKLVERLDEEPKCKNFGIITNGTIKLKKDLLLALSKSNKFRLDISDYSSSPNLKIPLYQKEIISSLKEYGIPYQMKFEDKPLQSWWDFGKIYKRNRSKEANIKNFRACSKYMVCVSVMSNEGLDKKDDLSVGGGDCKGQVFICPVASSLSRLKGLDEFEGDFLRLDSTLTKKKILRFYSQEFFKACDYCHDYSKAKIKYIPVGIQTDKIFELSKDR